MALPQAWAPPLSGLSHHPRPDQVGPLRSARVTRLPRYYEPVRPFALALVRSAPHGSTTWRSPLASRLKVPTFRTRACARAHAVLACRSPLGSVIRCPPSLVLGQQLEPGFDDIPTLSTRRQRFTLVRLPRFLPDGLSRLFDNAHDQGHGTPAACRGLRPNPAIRSRGADPHLLRS